MNALYIVTAYRWGSRSNHSYNVAAEFDIDTAICIAESHATYRGGKYACVVEKLSIGGYDEDADNYSTIVYKTSCMMDQNDPQLQPEKKSN